MSIIIVALPKMEDAKRIRKILMSHGFEHVVSCTTASAALIEANQHQRGLFIYALHSASGMHAPVF